MLVIIKSHLHVSDVFQHLICIFSNCIPENPDTEIMKKPAGASADEITYYNTAPAKKEAEDPYQYVEKNHNTDYSAQVIHV